MEIILDKEIPDRKKKYFLENMNINSSEITKERINSYYKARKNKINQELFVKENNIKSKLNKNNISQENDYELSIQELNIESELKNENYIKALLCEDNLDKIFEFII